MDWRKEWKPLAVILVVFGVCWALPVGGARFDSALLEALHLVKWYAREHVLLCLVPAFFIAGAIGVFLSQASVMRYLGAGANRLVAYGVASVSGSILAVCSCTVLPLFAGIYRMGAGLGPATAFLYSGPAINVLAIILTARVLGLELGIARAVGAVLFSIVIGLVMHVLFRKEERAKAMAAPVVMPEAGAGRPLWQTALYFASMIGILVFANWGAPQEYHFTTVDGQQLTAAIVAQTEAGAPLKLKLTEGAEAGQEITLLPAQIASREPVAGLFTALWRAKWLITGGFALLFGFALVAWLGLPWWQVGTIGAVVLTLSLTVRALPSAAFTAGVIGLALMTGRRRDESGEWMSQSWGFAKQILPLLLWGVLIAGALLGRPGHEGLIPSQWISGAVGGNSLASNFVAAFVGAFMYFATLTEVPILQGLIGAGMGKGPALALLLAGPALSLPNMLVIRSVLGTRKTVTFVTLVIVMATASGLLYGAFAS